MTILCGEFSKKRIFNLGQSKRKYTELNQEFLTPHHQVSLMAKRGIHTEAMLSRKKGS
jgi:hypothetical protein